MARIVRKANVDPWPRVFHPLRASLESDLAQYFPLAAAAKWLGNTPSVAMKHYVDPTDPAFEQAVGWTPGGAVAVQNPVQSGADASGQDRTHPVEVLGNPEKSRVLSDPVGYWTKKQRECMGIEPTGSLIQTPRRF